MRTRSALIACSPTAYPSHRTEQPWDQPPDAIRRLHMSSLNNTAMLAASCLVVAALGSSQARAGVTTELASVGPLGVMPNNTSQAPSLSADGRLVAFSSLATNLVPGTPT